MFQNSNFDVSSYVLELDSDISYFKLMENYLDYNRYNPLEGLSSKPFGNSYI